MARESGRESGREICERLDVRQELRGRVIYIFDEGVDFVRANNMYVDFLKECFDEDDLKGIIVWEMIWHHVPGARKANAFY
jgi:hypothetical protein